MSDKPMKTYPVKNLSGEGFTFEDCIGAWVAVAMLAGTILPDPELGPPPRVDFQVNADGWRLNDIFVSFADARWCASIKSYPQIDARKAAADFVMRAWEEILGVSGSDFNPNIDLLGMVTSPIDAKILGDIHDLIQLTRAQESKDLSSRIYKPGYKGKRQQILLNSFTMPPSLEPPKGCGITTPQARYYDGFALSRLILGVLRHDRRNKRLDGAIMLLLTLMRRLLRYLPDNEIIGIRL